jgi:hypothetical protein
VARQDCVAGMDRSTAELPTASTLALLFVNHRLLIETASAAAAMMIPREILREVKAAFRKSSNATSVWCKSFGNQWNAPRRC